MVAEKLDPTFGQFCFRCNFQTVRNLQKGTTEMSSGGPKMVERSYGLAGNGLKWQENHKMPGYPRWPPLPLPLRRPDPGASDGGWPWNLAGVTVRRWRTFMAGACCSVVAGGASFGPISHGSQMVKMTQLGSTSFGELF